MQQLNDFVPGRLTPSGGGQSGLAEVIPISGCA